MTKSREILRLDDLAFEALLRHRMEITPNSQAEYEVLMRHKLKREIPDFLQAIADGNQAEVEAMLDDNPQLVEVAFGTVMTPSLDTIENVSAIQLAYILEDERIGKVLADAVDRLNNPAIKAKVSEELAIKISEIEEQESQFKKFDFTDLVNAITSDTNLAMTGKASPETAKAFADFKEYFQSQIVTNARPFHMKDLQQCYEIYDKNFPSLEVKQLIWFLCNVSRFLLGRVAASYGQAFSHGLTKPFDRSFKLKNQDDDDKPDLLYYSSCHSHDVPDNFVIDIYSGSVSASTSECAVSAWPTLVAKLTKHCEEKARKWEEIRQQLQVPQKKSAETVELKNNSNNFI